MILVTGATSRSGSRVVRRLARQHQHVRALTRHRGRAAALEGLDGVEVVTGNMLRPDTLGPALDGVTRALVISSSQERLVETQSVFIDAAARAGVPHVVKLSGAESGIGFDPEAFRGTRAHEQVERHLVGSGIAWTIVRPSQFMQMYLLEAGTIATEGAMYLPMEQAELAPVDLDDVAAVCCVQLTGEGHEGRRYEMTGPEALDLARVAAAIGSAIGRDVRYVDVPPGVYRDRLVRAGVPLPMIDTLDEIFAERRRRPRSRVDLSTHEALGVHPTTFLEFARRNAAVFSGDAS